MSTKKELSIATLCFILLCISYAMYARSLYAEKPPQELERLIQKGKDMSVPQRVSSEHSTDVTSAYDLYAQQLGYKDGNDYILNGRTKNKTGKLEKGGLTREQWGATHKGVAIPAVMPLTTFSIEEIEPTGSETLLLFNDVPSLSQEAGETYVGYTLPNHHSHPEYTRPSDSYPSVSVQEPSSLILLITGMVGLLIFRNKKSPLKLMAGFSQE